MLRSNNGLNKGALIALISSLIVLIDYITKKAIVSRVMLYERINVLPFLNIVHIENKGAAFSLLTNLDNNYFIAISIIAVCGIIFYLSQLPKGLELFSLSVILGGAIGNLVDRLRAGKVIDFIDIFVGGWHWPAFNIADSALTVGIMLFLLANVRRGKMTKVM